MYKVFPESRPAAVILAMLAATILSGCVTDDETSQNFVPYRLEDRYPLTTQQAMAVRKADPKDLCRNWSQDLADTGSNKVAPNHGCAVRVNMAAMIADPTVIDDPYAMPPAPAAPAANAVNKIGADAPAANRSIFSLF